MANSALFNGMQIPCAWTLSNGNQNIIIAIMDKYIDDEHFDLVGKIPYKYGTNNPINQDLNHGVQSVGAAVGIRNNGTCSAGSGGNSRVAAYRGQYANNSNIIDASNKGYQIISISAWNTISRATMVTATQNGTVVLVAGLD
ncbi:hypothetical protein GCM10007940_13590 [Portibacter lacus]|uniref:Peptidase S8/S53 domain-containing protein n=2 Tax=Portibacter lacus TaxID=1099794 RepID=A0AA37SNG9_9BACT|nr:hypothetical protein GCM10007940_13590 [Portibacter lacus]